MTVTERRTQIYLTEEQYQAAVRLARDRDASLAAIVREALDRYLAAVPKASAPWAGDPVHALVGSLELPPLAEGEAADLDEAIDASVYGEP